MQNTRLSGSAKGGVDPGALLPCEFRPGFHRPGAETKLDHGFGAPITYRFNSCGYRGEDLDAEADFRICVFGESHAAGHGVEIEESFGHRLKLHVAAALGLDPARVNCLNFASSGSSIDYCVRTMFRQLTRFPADLVVCNLPTPDRVEYLGAGEAKTLNLRLLDPERLDDAPEPLLAFADVFTPQMGDLWMVKALLLMQAFCRQRGIGHVLAMQHRLPVGRRALLAREFLSELDRGSILFDRVFTVRPDKAADGKHGGPRSHAGFALSVLDHLARSAQADTGLAEVLPAYLDRAKASDPDWQFCQDALAARPAPGRIRTVAAGQAGRRPPRREATFRLSVIGDKGLGAMDVAQTMAAEIAAALGVPVAEVDVADLTQPHLSPECCVRTAYQHVPAVRPDLVVCCMPPSTRFEYQGEAAELRAFDLSLEPAQEDEALTLEAFADFTTDETRHVGLMKSMLLVQHVCNLQGTAIVTCPGDLSSDLRARAPLCGFDNALEEDGILEIGGFGPGRMTPPRTLAIAALDRAARQLERLGHNVKARQLTHHVRGLVQAGPDTASHRRTGQNFTGARAE